MFVSNTEIKNELLHERVKQTFPMLTEDNYYVLRGNIKCSIYDVTDKVSGVYRVDSDKGILLKYDGIKSNDAKNYQLIFKEIIYDKDDAELVENKSIYICESDFSPEIFDEVTSPIIPELDKFYKDVDDIDDKIYNNNSKYNGILYLSISLIFVLLNIIIPILIGIKENNVNNAVGVAFVCLLMTVPVAILCAIAHTEEYYILPEFFNKQLNATRTTLCNTANQKYLELADTCKFDNLFYGDNNNEE